MQCVEPTINITGPSGLVNSRTATFLLAASEGALLKLHQASNWLVILRSLPSFCLLRSPALLNTCSLQHLFCTALSCSYSQWDPVQTDHHCWGHVAGTAAGLDSLHVSTCLHRHFGWLLPVQRPRNRWQWLQSPHSAQHPILWDSLTAMGQQLLRLAHKRGAFD